MTLSSRLAGVVRSIRVKPGDRVTAGAVVVEFDRADIEEALKSAESARVVTPANARAVVEAVEMARVNVSGAKTEPERAKARAALDKALGRQAELRAKSSAVEAARHAAEAMRDSAVVRSPVAGLVTAVLVTSGNLVAGDTPLVQLEPSDLYFETTVENAKLETVAQGTLVEVSVERQPCKGPVEIAEIADSAAVGMKNVRTAVPCRNARADYRGVMTFRGTPQTVVSVANAAVIRPKDVTSVFLVEDGVAKLRRITLGGSNGARVEAIAGLAPGAKVVLVPPAGLKDNAPVVVAGSAK